MAEFGHAGSGCVTESRLGGSIWLFWAVERSGFLTVLDVFPIPKPEYFAVKLAYKPAHQAQIV